MSRHDSAINLSFPAAASATGHGAFGFIRTEMLDFLPLRFSRAAVILAGLGPPTHLVRWSHVVGLVLASKLQRPDVLNDPALANTINSLFTDHAIAPRPLPDGQPLPRRKPAP